MTLFGRVVPDERVTRIKFVLIAAVWVNPQATNETSVFENNRTATREALRAGRDGTPSVADALAARHAPHNAFYRP